MVKRLISAQSSEILAMSTKDLKESIRACEGRVILSESIVSGPAPVKGLTHAEMAAAFGADLVCLNELDLLAPKVYGLTDKESQDFARVLHRLTGRPIGVNLEPVDPEAPMGESRVEISEGRKLTPETLDQANSLGLNFVCLTGNPAAGVSNRAIIQSVQLAKDRFQGLVIAGKMHGAGVKEPVISREVVQGLVQAGVDVLMLPSPGTLPGIRPDFIHELVDYAHSQDVLVMSAIGTSQEGADPETIRHFALGAKTAGVDIQHIGDGGCPWLTPLENIFHMSVAIRGSRHTYTQMARSINR